VKRAESGFTLVEVLLAVTVLGIGITALVGSSALVTRMVSRGQMSTRAAEVAAARLDTLRLLAYATTPKCTHAQFANGTKTNGSSKITEAWKITTNAKLRTIEEVVTQKNARGRTHSDTLYTVIGC
jgi:prepilin-type N-terminal cleavage/methylation domain-containing protein